MPLYEYDCPECGRFEILQKISDKPLKSCPQCAEAGKKNKVTRAVSAAAFHLKGSGWYKTDYAASSGNGNGKSHGKKKETKDTPAASAAPAASSDKS